MIHIRCHNPQQAYNDLAQVAWPAIKGHLLDGGRPLTLGTKGGRVTPRKSREGGTLIEAVSARQTWATATARDWRSGKASQATHDKNSRPLSERVGGLLNPNWVEWLMGWPIGWTELKPLAMDRFREWQQQHGECLEVPE